MSQLIPDPTPLNVFVGTGSLTDANLLIAQAEGSSSPLGYSRVTFFVTVSGVSVNPSDIVLSSEASLDGSLWADIPGELPSTTTAGQTSVGAYEATYASIAPGTTIMFTLPFGTRALRIYARMADTGRTGTVSAVSMSRFP